MAAESQILPILPSDPRRESRECIAAHELGHFVALRKALIPVKELRLFSCWFSDSAYGHCELKQHAWTLGADGEPDRAEVRGYMVSLMAGQAAVDHFYKLCGEEPPFTAESDYEFFRELFRENSMITEEAAKAEAETIIAMHWEEIARYMDEFADRGRLAGRKIS